MMGAAGLGANSIPNDNVRGIKVSDGQGLRSVWFPHHQNRRWSSLSSTQMCIFFCSCIGDSLGRSGSASLRFTGRCCIPNVIRQFFTACPETKFFVCVCLTLPFRQAHGLGVYPVWMLVLKDGKHMRVAVLESHTSWGLTRVRLKMSSFWDCLKVLIAGPIRCSDLLFREQ